MLYPVEDIETLSLGRQGFGDQLGGHVSGVYAMTGIGLGIKNIGTIRQPTDLR